MNNPLKSQALKLPPESLKTPFFSLLFPFTTGRWGRVQLAVKWLNWLAVCIGLLAVTCSHQLLEPQTHTSAGASYTISIPALHQDSLLLSCTFESGTGFILPYHFFDNPTDSFDGPPVRDLHVTDAAGAPVDFRYDSASIGPVMNRLIQLPSAVEYPVTFTYRIDFSVMHPNTTPKLIPVVHIGNGSLYLPGAYFLIIPELSTSLTGLWRTRFESEVTVTTTTSPKIYGIPAPTFTCSTLYELLFLQLSAGHEPVSSGHGGSVDFVFLDYVGKTYPQSTIDSVTTLFSGILDHISSVYGPFSGSPFTVSFQNIWGGIEGSFGFSICEPSSGPNSRFAEILAHEALHCFVGIRCGDYDDPWWKESAAAYLGLETLVQLKFYDKLYFRGRMTAPFTNADTARFQRALSDPWLRENMFSQSLHGLVYERGAQVMMLLDVAVRRGSNNRYSLHNVTADLCSRYLGAAFHRQDFISTLENFGAKEARNIFSTFVDRPDTVMSETHLIATFEQLDSLARY